MVKFKKPSFAAAAINPYERALTAITRPDVTPHGRRHMAATVARCHPIAWPLHLRKLFALKVVEQKR